MIAHLGSAIARASLLGAGATFAIACVVNQYRTITLERMNRIKNAEAAIVGSAFAGGIGVALIALAAWLK